MTKSDAKIESLMTAFQFFFVNLFSRTLGIDPATLSTAVEAVKDPLYQIIQSSRSNQLEDTFLAALQMTELSVDMIDDEVLAKLSGADIATGDKKTLKEAQRAIYARHMASLRALLAAEQEVNPEDAATVEPGSPEALLAMLREQAEAAMKQPPVANVERMDARFDDFDEPTRAVLRPIQFAEMPSEEDKGRMTVREAYRVSRRVMEARALLVDGFLFVCKADANQTPHLIRILTTLPEQRHAVDVLLVAAAAVERLNDNDLREANAGALALVVLPTGIGTWTHMPDGERAAHSKMQTYTAFIWANGLTEDEQKERVSSITKFRDAHENLGVSAYGSESYGPGATGLAGSAQAEGLDANEDDAGRVSSSSDFVREFSPLS